jgi:hypothetical protein
MITITNDKFITIVGDVATDIFDYYGVAEMHGLNRADAQAQEVDMTTGNGVYIYGFTNYDPRDIELKAESPLLPFLFLNSKHFTKTYFDATLIMHETSHMVILLNDWNIKDKEEAAITQSEIYANRIIEILVLKNIL